MRNMRKAWWVALTACAIAASAGMSAVRADDEDEAAEGAEQVREPGKRLDKLKKELALTEEQATKLKAAFEAGRAAMKPLRDKLRENMKKLQEQIRSEAKDPEVQATLAELKSLRDSIAAQRQKLMSELEAVLSPTQRAKMLLRMEHRLGKMRKEAWEHGNGNHREGEEGRKKSDK